MPLDTEKRRSVFFRFGILYKAAVIMAVFMSVLIFSCSSGDKKEHLKEKITDTKPIVSPIISDNVNISKGNDLFLKGQFQNAIQFYQQGLAQNRAVAFYNMGVSYYLLGDIVSSEDAFRQAVKENPDFKEAYANLAVVLIQTGKLDEAEKYVRQLLKDDNSAKMLVNMANIYLRRGETAKAAEYYQVAIKKGENSKYVMSNYAYFLMTVGEYKTGISILENLPVKDYTDYYNLASAYYNEGMYQQAARNITTALGSYNTEEALNLAALSYFGMGDYNGAIRYLTTLISKHPTEDYKYRLAKALFLAGRLPEADAQITALLTADPNKQDYYRLKYEILIGENKIADAGNLAQQAYNRFGTDDMLYVLVKHKIIYHEDMGGMEQKLTSGGNSPYLNLARTAFYIYKDKMVPARQYIAQVPSDLDNDYYLYQAYIMLKYKQYSNVLAYASKINKNRPEYFWYRAAVYFSTNNLAGLKQVIGEEISSGATFSKGTNVRFHLIPRIKDIDFSYRFDGTYDQMLTLMMYPLFIDPSEMMSFVAMGYKMLKENSKLVALRELQRSVEYSDGIKMNNDGVADMFAYRFKDAYAKFSKANEMLNDNPYTLYNMGLAKLNMGEIDTAAKFFDAAVLQNNYFLPAYLGLAVTANEVGHGVSTPGEYYNIVTSRALQAVESKRKLPHAILYSSFLADMGLGRYSKVMQDIGSHKKDSAFLNTVYSLAKYMNGGGFKSLDPLAAKNGIYRARAVRDLIGTVGGQIKTVDSSLYGDRAYKFMKIYAMTRRGLNAPQLAYSEYAGDPIAMKEMVYYSIMHKDRNSALNYLRQVSTIDIRYKELYKASLYYFLWTEDFVNAEASYTTLTNLRASDRYSEYYKLLYFILDYNGRRLMNTVSDYMKKYPNDPLGKEARMIYALRSENFEMTLNAINDIEGLQGNFLKELPLEISIDGL